MNKKKMFRTDCQNPKGELTMREQTDSLLTVCDVDIQQECLLNDYM